MQKQHEKPIYDLKWPEKNRGRSARAFYIERLTARSVGAARSYGLSDSEIAEYTKFLRKQSIAVLRDTDPEILLKNALEVMRESYEVQRQDALEAMIDYFPHDLPRKVCHTTRQTRVIRGKNSILPEWEIN